MSLWRGFLVACCLMLLAAPGTPRAQEDEAAEDSKELKFAGTPYAYTGPDTGLGFGFSIMFRDLFDKEGRDATFSATVTQTRYQSYGVDWGEPYFLSDRGRLNLSVGYDNKPAIRFYGLGNDSTRNHRCNWSWVKYDFSTSYVYRWPRTDYGVFGLRASAAFAFVNADNGGLKDDSDEKYYRTIKEVFPRFYRSDNFDENYLVGVGLTLYRDNRVDRFPLGGGREEVVWPMRGTYEEISLARYDEAIGSDFSFNRVTVDLRQVFPLFSEDTILVIREKMVINQGNVPFYEMVNYGGGNDLRGYYGYRFIDKNATQLNVELRQGFLPDYELPLLKGLVKLKYPSIFIFWDEARVYGDYEDMADELFEDYHYTWGYGVRFVITPTVVIRLEWGFSDEQVTFAANAGLPF